MNTIVFDVDGTICPIKKVNEEYKDLIPYADMVNKIRKLKEEGYKIVFFTARNMRTYNADINKILKYTKPVLETWLQKWEIPYDEVIYGKPYPGKEGFYVDDKTLRPDELLSMNKDEISLFLKGSDKNEI
jgi:capsule biosynthesis phosphatase